jgi:protein ImuB
MSSVTCIYFRQGIESQKLAALAEACMRFSSQVALRPEEAVFVETGRNRLIHEPGALTLRLKALAARYGDGPQLALGRHAAEALALARYGAASVAELPMEALLDYASPFLHLESVDDWLGPMIAALKSLGLSRLGSLLRLPQHSVGERFGADAAMLRERVDGILEMAWPRYEAPALMQEREGFEAEEDFERLAFYLKRLVDRIAARLRGRGMRAARLKLEAHFERGGRKALDLRLALPQAAPSALLAVLRQAMEAQRRQGNLYRPIIGLGLAVPEMAPGKGSQSSLFDSRDKEMEQWSSLVTRLSQKLGDNQVFLAELVQRYLPERAWKRVLREPRSAPQAPAPAPAPALPAPAVEPPSRPSRLLPQPHPLWIEGAASAGIFVEMPAKQRWHARAWAGPERINGQWWENGFDRDYFRVSTEEGLDLWVYSESGAGGQAGKFWLHGYFD